MGCYFPGWGISIRVGVLVNEMGCYFTGLGVSKWDGVLVNGIQCLCTVWALINRIEC